ncbi:hypothetical protein FB107DRAFT_252906, partial [Schizophyllum commune]
MSVAAANVTDLIMGLNAPVSPTTPSTAQSSSFSREANSSPYQATPTAKPAKMSSGRGGSGNWRHSMSSTATGSMGATTSTTAFTRYSNRSRASVSSTATSVSGTSWWAGGGGSILVTACDDGDAHLPAQISALQLASKLRKPGSSFCVGDILPHPTVQRLAKASESETDKAPSAAAWCDEFDKKWSARRRGTINWLHHLVYLENGCDITCA